jgi:hypothetical protein
MSMTRVAWVAVAFAVGCTPPAEPIFPVRVEAMTTTQQPLAGVHAWLDGQPLGASDVRGLISGRVRGHEGAARQLTVACPSGYRSPPPRRIGLRHVATAEGASAPLAMRVSCEATQTYAALVVRTQGNDDAAFPILVDGDAVGVTDGEVGHVLVEVAPNSTLRVALDTSSRSKLEPRDPVQSFRVGGQDTVLLFEQRFSTPPKPKRRRIARAKAAPEPEAPKKPYRIR